MVRKATQSGEREANRSTRSGRDGERSPSKKASLRFRSSARVLVGTVRAGPRAGSRPQGVEKEVTHSR